MITSPTNDKVKMVRRLQTERRFRAQEQLFVVEGDRWLAELIRHQVVPRSLFFTTEWQSTHAEILQQLAKFTHQPGLLVNEAVMAAMSDTTTPPGVLAVAPTPHNPLPARPSLLLILDAVNNPGNLGTMLRTAVAAGVDGVLLTPGSVDATNPKVVRGSMGALLRLAVHALGWAQIGEVVQGMTVWLADVEMGEVYTAVNWQSPSALIIGSEAGGAGQEAHRLANGRVTIPMHAATESLNAAIAAGVILFEARRQREE
ncbi:MAG TPA: RNA methyltransferase [Chloroflexota bacterium]|nr:RNA methyltransferase [Chloroflexota bacterium]